MSRPLCLIMMALLGMLSQGAAQTKPSFEVASKLPAGEYNCQITILDPTGQKAAFWQAPVMLVR